jgi:type IV fimbrial biogenesis protein FimT
MSIYKQQGWTLVEALASVALVGVLLSVSLPMFSSGLGQARMQSGADRLLNSLWLTRSEAIRRNHRVVVCKSLDGTSCSLGTDWSVGWIVFADPNNNAKKDEDEPVLHRQTGVQGDWQLRGNVQVRDFVSYGSLGDARKPSRVLQMGSLVFCHPSPSMAKGKKVVINSMGRPRMVNALDEDCTW